MKYQQPNTQIRGFQSLIGGSTALPLLTTEVPLLLTPISNPREDRFVTRQSFHFTLFFLICFSIPLTATAQMVDIPDPNLRAAIEEELGKAPGATITVADMAALTILFAAEANITDLTGLEAATSLTWLWLGHNNISDISALAGLTQLTTLWLDNNSISDISALAGLTQLTNLDLWNNSISDLSPLVANTGLGSGDRVNVRGNFLSALSINTHIPTLQSRGVIVVFDNIVVQPEDHARTVDIPDPNLRAVIETDLGKAPGTTITVADMENLTILFAPNANISDLTGLEAATNLTLLDLGAEYVAEDFINSNSISDLSPLAGLTNLTYLSLRNNSISDISAVIGLTNLEFLYLGNNSISDVSPIAGLTNLTDLWLQNNSISDISAVIGLTNLEFLYLGNNSISDVSPIAGLTNLTILWIDRNTISDISPIAGLTNLTILWLDDNSISDISALAGLTNLTELWLYSNFISDISALAGLTNLTELWLQNNSISDLSPLVENTGLGNGDFVHVTENFLNALSINTHIPALQSRGVTVGFDNIIVQPEDIAQTVDIPDPNLHAAIAEARGKAPDATITLADMLVLTYLDARNANISDLTGLERATNLKVLYLNEEHMETEDLYINTNSVSDLSPLAELTNLTLLWLNDNSISDISPLTGLTNLIELDLWNNSVSDISPLAGLTQLTYLDIGDNSISDISPLVENTGLGNEDFVDVTGNPLSALSINTHIPALQSRGVEVWVDDIVARPADVNDDGVVNIFDLVSVASHFGKQGQNLTADVNRDAIVDILDLVFVAGMFGDAAAAPSAHPQAPETLTAAAVRQWLTDATVLEVQDPIMKRGIRLLEQLLASLTPTETELLANYPNPFNPETWIPYRLADDAFVTLTIYDLNGQVVRALDMGHQTAAVYESRSKAIYWDGRNNVGEQVASGVYFYHLSAGNYSATRKMLILK